MKRYTKADWGNATYECSYCGEQHSEAISCPHRNRMKEYIKFALSKEYRPVLIFNSICVIINIACVIAQIVLIIKN